MVNSNKRQDINDLNRGQVIVLSEDSVDRVIAYPTTYLTIKGGSIDYSKYLASSLYSDGIDFGDYINVDGEIPKESEEDEIYFDIPELTDIESVTYEPYTDPASKSQKIRAILKIRNSSRNPSAIEGVDARIFNPSVIVPRVSTNSTVNSSQFITPTPGVPNVYFKRNGTSIAWGWNNVSGLGSFSEVRYDWIISSSSSSTAPALESGSETYSTTDSFNIGNSGVMKTYRVSSRDGDVAATSQFRWLRVKAVVTGTNGAEYSSSYSAPI